MSAIHIVAIIIGLLGALICYLFITQTLEKKRKERQRLVQALHQRAKIFRYILSGFPPNFLPKDIVLLVQRCLTDVLQQLAAMEPGESQHAEDLALLAGQIELTRTQEVESKRPTLQSVQQVKDVREHLQELHKFLLHLQRRGGISKIEAESYSEQIRELVLKVSVDAYLLQAKVARQGDKLRLAIHYYGLAKKLLEKDPAARYRAQIQKLDQLMVQLEAKLGEEVVVKKEAGPLPDKAWGQVEDANAWKKKNIYD